MKSQKNDTIEAEVVVESTTNENHDTNKEFDIESFKKRIHAFGEFNEEIADTLDSKLKLKDVDPEEMVVAIRTIHELASSGSKAGGVMDDMIKAIPLLGKVFKDSKEKFKESLAQNTTVKEAVQTITDSLKQKTIILMENIENLTDVEELLISKVEESSKLQSEVENALKNSKGLSSGKIIQLQGLQTQIGSIHETLERTKCDLVNQMQSTQVITSNIQNILPVLKLIMTVQTTLANNGKQMENLKLTVDAASTFCRTLAKKNAEASSNNYIHALDMQQSPIIDAQTMKEITVIDKEGMKKFAEKLNKFQLEYKELQTARLEFKKNTQERNEKVEAIS